MPVLNLAFVFFLPEQAQKQTSSRKGNIFEVRWLDFFVFYFVGPCAFALFLFWYYQVIPEEKLSRSHNQKDVIKTSHLHFKL